MANIKLYTKILITVIIVNSTTPLDTRFPNQDPKNEILITIDEGVAAAYCLIHIEKGKRFIPVATEPDDSEIKPFKTEDWFKSQKPTLKLINKSNDTEKISTGAVAGKKLQVSLLQEKIRADAVYDMLQYVNPDKSIFTPKHTTANGDGYGIIADCYMNNEKQKIKRQVRYLFCMPTHKKFAILNFRLVNDGDNGKSDIRWQKERAGLDLEHFAEGGDRFFTAPLSPYADGFLDIEEESNCMLRIKSGTYLIWISWVSAFSFVLMILK